jgi:3-oxoacyl-[acyl-carrier-protein] synthase III
MNHAPPSSVLKSGPKLNGRGRRASTNRSAVRLLGLGVYLPERVMANDEWSQYVDTTDEWITTRTGIKRRHVAAPHETTATLAVAAARDALARLEMFPEDIDEIIVVTDTPEVCIPDTAPFVQYQLGAREVPSYTLSGSGCAGFLQALEIASSRVSSGVGRVLIVGAELLTRLVSWQDRNTCVLFGDAAAAAVIGQGAAGAEILAIVAGTDGSQTGILTMEVGGTRHPFTLEAARQGKHQHVTMNGKQLFRHAIARMSEAAVQVLAKAQATLQDVSLVIPHQANLRIVEGVANALHLPLRKFFIDVQDYGNTGSASVPLALWDAQKQGKIAPGNLVLTTSFGAGLHWAAALLRF